MKSFESENYTDTHPYGIFRGLENHFIAISEKGRYKFDKIVDAINDFPELEVKC